MSAFPRMTAIAILVVCGTVFGQEAESDDNLERWKALSESQRQEIRDKAASITPEQLKTLRGQMAKFRKLSKEEQERILSNYRRFKKLSPDEQTALREKHSIPAQPSSESTAPAKEAPRTRRRRGKGHGGPKGKNHPAGTRSSRE